MFKDYMKEVNRTCSQSYKNIGDKLEHGIIGVSCEAGELLDALKAAKFYGKPLDLVNVQEELGDIMWFLTLTASAMNISIDDILNSNIRKLRKRYPNGKWDAYSCFNRDTEAEMMEMLNESIGLDN